MDTAILPVNPRLFNVTAIVAQQANNDGSSFLFNDDFANWNAANQPYLTYMLLNVNNFFILISDADVAADYMANWM